MRVAIAAGSGTTRSSSLTAGACAIWDGGPDYQSGRLLKEPCCGYRRITGCSKVVLQTQMHKLLEGKRAVITGASRGLGPVIAEAMWEQGATLLLVARSTEPLNQLRLRLEENAGLDQSVSIFAADLADEASPKKIFDEARSLWPSIDVLVNN